jgi:6-phosphofructokinase 1
MDWMSVNGWASMGGSELGTNRKVPKGPDMYLMARTIEKHNLQALLIIGGWEGYETAHRMMLRAGQFPRFQHPDRLPASYDQQQPARLRAQHWGRYGPEQHRPAVDKIKQSAVASRRVFVVEVMGRYCGYLALMSGLATGAERVYLHEEGVS